jgi:hypothetical protein
MLGRQVNFYMLPADQLAFENWLKKRGDVCFLQEPFKTQEIETLPTLIIPEMGKTRLRVYLAHPANLQKIILDHRSWREGWHIDFPLSPVVQFDRCYYDGKIIRRGRLYFQPRLYEDEVEEKQFADWADKLLRWIRRNYERRPQSFEYVGPQAKK